MKIVEVVWNDAWIDDHETTVEQAIEDCVPCRVVSIGYLLASTPAGVVLARNYDPKIDQYQHRYMIPSGMMLSMRTLDE